MSAKQVQTSPWPLVRLGSFLGESKQIVGDAWQDTLLLSLTLKGVIPRDMENRVGKLPESFSTYQKVNRGDLIFCLFDVEETPRTVGLVHEDGMVTSAYTVMRSAPSCDPRFLAYAYLRFDQDKSLKHLYAGLRNTIRRQDFKNIRIPLPDLTTQKLVADYLDRETAEIDAFLEDLKQLKAYTAERARALLEHELWATAKEFAPLRRFLLRVDQGISPEADSSPAGPGELGVLKAGCTNHGRFDLWANKRLDNSDQFTASMFVAEGDLIVTRASGSLMHVGSAALVPHLDRQLAMSDKHYRLVTDDHLDSEYLALVMQTARWRTQLEPLVSGAQGLARNISISNLKTLEVPVVSRMQQEEVKEKLREQVQKVAMASDDVDALISLGEERRSALISAAVTGQIDVTAQGMSAAEQLQDELEAKV